MRLLSTISAAFAALLFSFVSSAGAEVTTADFAEKPLYRGMELSPSGKKLAVIIRQGSEDFICILPVSRSEGKLECLAKAEDLKPRRIIFINEDTLVFIVSKNTKTLGYRGRYEYSAAFLLDLKTKKTTQLLKRTEELYPAQGGLGKIVGISPDKKSVYMPAYSGRSGDPPRSLFVVKLKTGRGRIVEDGRHSTLDYIMNSQGKVIAREDYNNNKNQYRVRSYTSGKMKIIYEEEAEINPGYIVGLSSDEKSLILIDDYEGGDSEALFKMNLENGDVTGPLFYEQGKEIDNIFMDANRYVYGVKYSGMTPSYNFADPKVHDAVNGIIDQLPMLSVHVDSWSDDWSKLLLEISGAELAGAYFMLDVETGQLNRITSRFPNITDNDVAEIATIEYKARDGLTIPAIVTFPNGLDLETTKNAPIIVLPHGGPSSYDKVGFDWMAQLFANQGYLVFQPNFRGSTGFGRDFTRAGYGEWGNAMQNDVTDGLDALVKMGWADPDRACIVGWSYGGYSALAGGAFTPDKYKCVVSINGVSDLPRMLIDERRDHGSDHWVYAYWKDLIGDPRSGKDALKEISPAFHAEKFQAPVLLIHGNQDLIVPLRQSKRMEDALKDAGKPVELIVMKKQGHSLATANARVEAFDKIVRFVNQHIGNKSN